MRNTFLPVAVVAAVMLAPLSAAGQGAGSGSGPSAAATSTSTRTSKPAADGSEQAATRLAPPPSPAATRLKSNVRVELTITDQIGKAPSETKTVSMIAASGTWGKIRASGVARPNEKTGWVPVGLNVDARPFVFTDGLVQIELTIGYNPLGPQPENAQNAPGMRPTELNQSMTVSLTDGKPMVLSQAADPVSDRKIIVEVKATVLK